MCVNFRLTHAEIFVNFRPNIFLEGRQGQRYTGESDPVNVLTPVGPRPPGEAVRVGADILVINYFARGSRFKIYNRKFFKGGQLVAVPRKVSPTEIFQVVMETFACRHTVRGFDPKNSRVVRFAELRIENYCVIKY